MHLSMPFQCPGRLLHFFEVGFIRLATDATNIQTLHIYVTLYVIDTLFFEASFD